MRSRLGALVVAAATMVLSAPAAAHADPAPSPSPTYDAARADLTHSPGPSYDVVARGARASVNGLAGSTVEITVGVHNQGPDSTEPAGVENPKRLFEVELPEGTELVEDPSRLCTAAIAHTADPRRFNCAVGPLEPDKGQRVTFLVRITGPVTSAGKVLTRAYGPGTDLDSRHGNDTDLILITTLAGYDIVAMGATVNGQVGSIVEITVGVKNLGPEYGQTSGGSGAPKHGFHVVLPQGTELVEDSSTSICQPVSLPPTNPRGFNCVIFTLAPGQSLLVTVKVRITAPTSGPGTISRGYGPPPDLDINAANNTALITITAGQLPQTGTDSKTIAVIGSGAVLLGGLLLLAVRRFGRRRE